MMDRNEAKELLEECQVLDDTMYAYNEFYMKALNVAIEALSHPEIIRCKDCKFNKKYGNDFSPRWCMEMNDDDFCSYAERLETLKPCPNCNEVWIYVSDYESKGYRVNCSCGYAWNTSSWAKTREEAVKRWNDGEK